MEMTYPLKNKEDIEEIKDYFLNVEKNKRNYLMFMIGISSALRISDILTLKVSDISPDGRTAKEKIIVKKEQKTDKRKVFGVSTNLRRAIESFLAEYTPSLDDFVFTSRQGDGKPITRHRAGQILKKAFDDCNLSHINFGTHGLRKTFAYHAWKEGIDITHLMKMLNHSHQGVTLAYITVEEDELNEFYIKLNM